MPPRYAYWTIIVDDQPTAFRAGSQEDLMPTFKRLKEKQPTAKMMWFQNGKLWESRIDAQEAMRTRGELGRRGDARQSDRPPFRDRARASLKPSSRFDSAKPEWKPKRAEGERSEWKPKAERPEWTPKSEARPEWKPKSDRPRSEESRSAWKPKRDGGDRTAWKPRSEDGARPEWKPKPHGRQEWKPKSDRPRSEDSRSAWKPKRDGGDRTAWKPKGDSASRPEWKTKSAPRSSQSRPGRLEWTPKSGHTGAKPEGTTEKRKWIPKEEYKKSKGIEAKRDSKWRPGGDHKDPKQKYKDAKKAKWGRFKDNIRKRWEAKGGKKRGD
jgi:hypothetical protein